MLQPLKGQLQRNSTSFLKKLQSHSHSQLGDIHRSNLGGTQGYWHHNSKTWRQQLYLVRCECHRISSSQSCPVGKIPLLRPLMLCICLYPIPHSSPWHLPSAPASDRPLPCGTGSLHGTSSSSLSRNHSPAPLLYMGRIKLSRSPARQTNRQR